MIAVIFEVWPAAGERDHYLAIAADLLPHLKQIDGFLSIERFESLSEPGKMLSLSFWRDEAAIAQWRQLEMHRTAQREGRQRHLSGLPAENLRGHPRLRHARPRSGSCRQPASASASCSRFIVVALAASRHLPFTRSVQNRTKCRPSAMRTLLQLPLQPAVSSLKLVKHKPSPGHQTPERRCMVPVQPIPKVKHREHSKHAQRNHLLNHL